MQILCAHAYCMISILVLIIRHIDFSQSGSEPWMAPFFHVGSRRNVIFSVSCWLDASYTTQSTCRDWLNNKHQIIKYFPR